MTDDRPDVRLRPAERDDVRQLYQWANDPTVRQRSISTEPIGWDEHVAWLAGVLSDRNRRLYVLEIDGDPVGQIRFDREDNHAVVNVSIDPSHRGEGLGRQIIHRGMHKAREDLGVALFVALIRPDNQPSRGAFEAAGYRPAGHEQRQGLTLLRLEHEGSARSNEPNRDSLNPATHRAEGDRE